MGSKTKWSVHVQLCHILRVILIAIINYKIIICCWVGFCHSKIKYIKLACNLHVHPWIYSKKHYVMNNLIIIWTAKFLLICSEESNNFSLILLKFYWTKLESITLIYHLPLQLIIKSLWAFMEYEISTIEHKTRCAVPNINKL